MSGPTPTLVTPAFATGISSPVDLQVAEDGSLYYLARGAYGAPSGVVSRITFSGNQAPSITQQPASITVSVGQPATFTVAASGTAPLKYQWQRNSVNISGATFSSYTLSNAQLTDSGSLFRCVVTNSFGTVTSNNATLTVLRNALPVPTIGSPPQGTLYSGGQTITYSGTATDAEDGTLPASAFTWEVVFHHDTHTHPFIAPITGATSGTFTIPTTVRRRPMCGIASSDGAGFCRADEHHVSGSLAAKGAGDAASSPSGLSLTLDGQPVVAPYTFTGVVGIRRTLGAPTPQTAGSRTYDFVSWSDGGAQTHTISTPTTNATFPATTGNEREGADRLGVRAANHPQSADAAAHAPATGEETTRVKGRVDADQVGRSQSAHVTVSTSSVS